MNEIIYMNHQRYNELLSICLNHDFREVEECRHFYQGMKFQSKTKLNASTKGWYNIT